MNTLLNTAAVSDLARQSRAKMYEIFDTPDCEPMLPPKAAVGESRLFTPNQALLLMVTSDLNRWGLTLPFAGKVACRIGEALFERPEAETLVIAFHENGASFFFAVDDATECFGLSDSGAGRVRFRVTLDLTAYRNAIGVAVEGARDEAA